MAGLPGNPLASGRTEIASHRGKQNVHLNDGNPPENPTRESGGKRRLFFGKAEVVSSILTGSTTLFQRLGRQWFPIAAEPSQGTTGYTARLRKPFFGSAINVPRAL